MKTLFILLAAAFAVSTLAQHVVRATPIPAGMQFHHANAVVGPDGIGHPVDGVNAQAAPDSVTLYENDQSFSGSYGLQGTTSSWEMQIPFLSQCCIDWMTFVYCADGVSGTDTVTVNLTFYDDAAGAGDVQCALILDGCTAPGAVNTSFTLSGLNSAGCWIYTITFSSPVTIIGASEVGWTFVGSTAGVVNIGPYISGGNNAGETFGYPFGWNYGGATVANSATARPVSWTIDSVGCYWFGTCSLLGNFMLSFHGHQPYEGLLKGDYGINGPTFARPRDHAYVMVTDAAANSQTNLVQLYTNPDTTNCWFGLPFAVAGPYGIQFMNQNAYLSSTAAGQMPNIGMSIGCAPVQHTYLLVSGDIGGDNVINLKDLSTVLKNFSKTGN